MPSGSGISLYPVDVATRTTVSSFEILPSLRRIFSPVSVAAEDNSA